MRVSYISVYGWLCVWYCGCYIERVYCQFCIYISVFQDKSFNAGECCVGVYHACNHAGDMLPYKQDKVSGADKVGE